MAYNIKPLRQQNLFEQFGLPSLSMDNSGNDPGYTRGEEDYNQAPDVSRKIYEPSSSDIFTSGPDLETLGTAGVTLGKPPSLQDPRLTTDGVDAHTKRIMDAIGQVYTPSEVDRDRNRNLLDNVPVREEPSFMRRLVAAGVGLGNKERGIPGGIAEQEKVLYAPYLRDMAEWKEKAGPFQQAAQIENTANVNERNLASSVVTGVINQDRYDAQARTADEKNRITEEKNKSAAETARIRAEAYDFKSRHPDWKFDFSGTTAYAYNPTNPTQRVNLGPTIHMTDVDKVNLQGEWNVAAAKARGEAAVTTAQAGAQASGRDLVIIDNQTYERQPDGSFRPAQGLPPGTPTRPGTPATKKDMSPGDVEKTRDNLLNEWYNTNHYYKRFIEEDPNNLGKLRPKSLPANSTIGDQYAYQEFLYELFPGREKPTAPPIINRGAGGGGATPPPPDSANPPPPTGATPGGGRTPQQQEEAIRNGTAVKIQDKNGKIFLADPKVVDAYIATGNYTRVR